MLVVVIHYIITKKLLNYRCRTARLRGNRAVQKKGLQRVQGYGVVQEYVVFTVVLEILRTRLM